MNLSIGKTLYLSFASILTLMLISAGIIWIKQNDSSRIAFEVASDDVPGAQLYLQLLDEVGDLRASATLYMLGTEATKADLKEDYQEFTEFLNQLIPLEQSSEKSRAGMDKIKNMTRTYFERVNSEIFAKYDPAAERRAYQFYKELRFVKGQQIKSLLKKEKEAQLAKTLSFPTKEDVQALRLILELEDEIDDLLTWTNKYITGDTTAYQEFNANKEEFSGFYRDLSRLNNAEIDVSEVKDLFNDLIKISEKIFTSYSPQSKHDALATLNLLNSEFVDKVEAIIDTESASEISEAKSGLHKLNESLDRAFVTLVSSTALAVLLGSVIAIWLSSQLTRRIVAIREHATTIASGNLSSEPLNREKNDELGHLADALNSMQSSLQQIIREISQVSHQVASASEDLTQSSEKISNGSHEQAAKAQQIATAAEEMTATVNNVASQTLEAASEAQKAGEEAEEGGKVMTSAVDSSQNVADLMSEIASTVAQLGKRSEEIGKVISVITSIAEQTNLLALNAAIEAARAGEAGRGFSVVADEVRGLAERTAQATKEVSESITAIQSETEVAVAKMDQGTSAVQEGVELSHVAGSALSKIVQRASSVNNMIQSIAAATEEQTMVTKEIATDITDISDIASLSVEMTDEASNTAAELREKVEKLEQLVREFKL